jgi:hypothetical protein
VGEEGGRTGLPELAKGHYIWNSGAESYGEVIQVPRKDEVRCGNDTTKVL